MYYIYLSCFKIYLSWFKVEFFYIFLLSSWLSVLILYFLRLIKVGGVVFLCGGFVKKNEARSLFFRGGEREGVSGSLSLYFSLGR